MARSLILAVLLLVPALAASAAAIKDNAEVAANAASFGLKRGSARRFLGASTQEEQSTRHVETASVSSHRELLGGSIAGASGTQPTKYYYNGRKYTTKPVYATKQAKAYHKMMVAKWNKAHNTTALDKSGSVAKGTVEVLTKGVVGGFKLVTGALTKKP